MYVRSDIPGNPDCLQNDISQLQDWSDKWLLSFHPDKCKVMHIGNHPSETNYTMRQSDNTILDIRDEMTERDLGIAIDNHLNFKLHISQTVSQANRLLGMTRRSFEHLDQETFLYLYKGLIQDLTRINKIATQGAPQMAVDKEANSLSRVYSYYSKFNLCLFYV